MATTLDNPAQDKQAQYGLEVLCASWNPLAAAIPESAPVSRPLVRDLATVDVEGFLASFYRSQQG